MISVVEHSAVAAPPERVWRLFAEMDRHYAAWHREHLAWRWLTPEPLAEGAVWFADEWVGRMRVQGRFFVTEVRPERFFAYRAGFPGSLVRAGGWFRFQPAPGGGCEIAHQVHLADPARLVVPIADLRRHMREEHANLPALLRDAG